MKIRCLAFSFFVLLLSAAVVHADSLPPDPHIRMGPTGSSGSFNQSQCFSAEVPFCSFTTDATGMAVIDITNDLGAFIVQDTVTLRTSFSGLLSCSADPETAPNWIGTPSGNSCIFTGGFISPGFIYGLTFSLFAANTTYKFDLAARTATTLPEPATIILLGTGLAAIAAGRKRLKGAKRFV